MTQIKIEVPANDHIALNAFAEALQRIAAERDSERTLKHDGGVHATMKELNGRIESVLNDALSNGDIEQVIDETSSVDLTPASGDVVIDALDKELDELALNIGIVRQEVERTDTAWQEMDKAYAQHVESLPEGIKQGEPCTQGDIDKLEVTLTNDTLDADGVPHDKRIHSKGATRLADDTWRLKRKPADKTDEEWDEYVKSVKAELKAVQDIPAPSTLDEQAIADLTPPVIDEPVAPVTPLTSLTPEPVIDEPATQFEGVTPNGDVAIEPPVAPVGSPVAPVTPPTSLTPPVVDTPSDQPSVTTFQELMLYITSNAKKRGADNDMIRETLLEVDPALTAIPLIATRADLIPKFVTVLEAKLS